MFSPGFIGIVAVAGALGAVGAAVAARVARDVGDKLNAADLLPAAPPRLPLPRFVYDKELMGSLRKR